MARRNLVIGCDGTWNEPEQTDEGEAAPTNVVKFMEALVDDGDGLQRQHYEEGVGGRSWETVRGGIYGYGLNKRIIGAYRFLQNRLTDEEWKLEENKVFILGFSRGAYTARRISGLIAHSGIPKKKKDVQLGVEIYNQKDQVSADDLKASGDFFDINVEMVGVWDTVKATNDADYHDGKLAGNVRGGYHAIAIDEKRKNFPTLKWNKNPRVTQVWFSGVHSDVGGGYADCKQADFALEWMIYRGVQHGLKFDADYVKEHVKPSIQGALHDSGGGIWTVLGTKIRNIPAKGLLHPSVRKRMKKFPSYRPRIPEGATNWKRTKLPPQL